VDDALGVVHTHGVAGLCGGLLVGLLADPGMIVYLGQKGAADVSFAGLFYGNPHQLLVQAGAAVTVIVWDALITFLILKFLGLFLKLRLPDPVLETGDLGVHGEEALPAESLSAVGTSAAPAPASAPVASDKSI